MSDDNEWDIVSKVVGWIYFSVWSVSFYGQLYENFKNKSCRGFSLDYLILNMVGFSSYAI